MKGFLKKLTSRKLWAAIIGFASAIGVIFGVEDIKIEQICALIGALGTLIAYILAEGMVDASGASQMRNDAVASAECGMRNSASQVRN